MKKNNLWVLIPCTLLFACSSAKSEFIDGCTSNGTPKSVCSCVYNKLEAEFGQEYLEKIHNRQAPINEALFESIFKAGQQCIK